MGPLLMSALTKLSAGALTAVRTNSASAMSRVTATTGGCVRTFYLKQVLQELLRGIERVRLITNSVDVVSSTGLSSGRSDMTGFPSTL
jgi:hypothetical protein